jgi:hypothetical protein
MFTLVFSLSYLSFGLYHLTSDSCLLKIRILSDFIEDYKRNTCILNPQIFQVVYSKRTYREQLPYCAIFFHFDTQASSPYTALIQEETVINQ